MFKASSLAIGLWPLGCILPSTLYTLHPTLTSGVEVDNRKYLCLFIVKGDEPVGNI